MTSPCSHTLTSCRTKYKSSFGQVASGIKVMVSKRFFGMRHLPYLKAGIQNFWVKWGQDLGLKEKIRSTTLKITMTWQSGSWDSGKSWVEVTGLKNSWNIIPWVELKVEKLMDSLNHYPRGWYVATLGVYLLAKLK